MPKSSPRKRTAQIVPKQSTKKHAAIVKKVPPTTLITGGTGFLGWHIVRQLVEPDLGGHDAFGAVTAGRGAEKVRDVPRLESRGVPMVPRERGSDHHEDDEREQAQCDELLAA